MRYETVSDVHAVQKIDRQGRDRAHQSCATDPSTFPPCGFDVGRYGDSTVVGCLVLFYVSWSFRFLNVEYFNNRSLDLRLFPSLFVSEPKELAIGSTVL